MNYNHYRPIFLFPLTLLWQCKQAPETTSPAIENITESVYASGIVKSRNQYNVYATVTGTVEEILVREGDLVKAGQPLLRLRNATTLLSSENARISAFYAEVNQNKNKLRELRLAVDLAKARLQNDSILMDRQNNLYQQGIGTKVEWEQRKLSYENSVTAYQSAWIRYSELQRQLSLVAEQTRLNAEIALRQLEDFTITSKVDGRVYWLQKEKGELVSPQTHVAIVGDADNFLLELEIDETDIARVAVGQKVLLILSSYPNKIWEGKLSVIKPIMNERSKLFTLEADFIKTPPALFPNLTVEANIIIQSKEKALTIPRTYLVNDSTVILQSGESRNVKIGLTDFQKAEIVSGLQAADVLVKPGK